MKARVGRSEFALGISTLFMGYSSELYSSKTFPSH